MQRQKFGMMGKDNLVAEEVEPRTQRQTAISLGLAGVMLAGVTAFMALVVKDSAYGRAHTSTIGEFNVGTNFLRVVEVKQRMNFDFYDFYNGTSLVARGLQKQAGEFTYFGNRIKYSSPAGPYEITPLGQITTQELRKVSGGLESQ